jgi:hypothetical protein
MMRTLLILALVASTARADAVLISIDSPDSRAADFGYTVRVVPGPKLVYIYLDLTAPAAKAFGTGDLTLMRGQQMVFEGNVTIQKDNAGKGTLKLTIDPSVIDGGEMTIWRGYIDGSPPTRNFGGFRLSIARLLQQAREPEAPAQALMKTMDGFRKQLPEPVGLGEMNGLGVEDINGVSHPDSHLKGIATRLGVKTKAECLVLLTYLKDKDPKMRRIAAFALEGVVNAYPGGMSSEDMQNVESAGHRKMVQAFLAGIEKLPR